MIISNPFSNAFGLDIGDSSIKLVRLEKKWRPGRGVFFEIDDIRQISLPPGSINAGEIMQTELVKEKIKILLGRHQGAPAIKTPWVVADLPVAKTFLKLIRIGVAPSEINDEIVKFEATKHLPVDIAEVNIDWQIIPEKEAQTGSTAILFGAVPKGIVESYTEILRSAGLYILALEIEDISIARAMITATKSYENEARAILDLGGSRSSLIIYDKGSIQFSSLINFSGDLIDTAIMQRLRIERLMASELKNNRGLSYVDQYPGYLELMTELSEKLAENIYQILLFYRDHFFKPNPVTHITMSGGMSVMLNLDKFLTDKLNIEAAPGNAWKNILNDNVGQNHKNGLALASAIGLAIRAAAWPIDGKKNI